MKLARPSDIQSLDFYSDDLMGKLVGIKPLADKTEVIKNTKWGDREALRIQVVAINHDGTELIGQTLSYWAIVNRTVLQAKELGNDYAVGVVEVEPQKNDPTRNTVVLIDPTPEQFEQIEAALIEYEAN